MKQFVESLFGLRKGERGLALMMFLYHYLLLITLYLLKPIRDSVFLTERGAPELPLVFMLTSVVVIPMAMLYTRAGRKLRMSWLVNGTTLVLVGSLLGLRWLLGAEELLGGWIYYVFYVWVSIYGVLITSQFWLFANAVFDAAQAKRVFAMLSLGAILGAVTGGELTSLLVANDVLQSINLIYVAAAILIASILVVNGIRTRVLDQQSDVIERSSDEEPMGLLGIFGILRGSRHLLLIVGIISLAVLSTTMVDFQFKSIAARLLDSEDELASYMGRFYSRVSVIALLFQIILAPKLIRMLGAGGSLLLLPMGLALGSAGFFLVPSLTAGTALRGIDQSLRHSIDRTGRELLFLPISLETKKRVKVFIDLFMDHGASGLGGILLLGLTAGLGMDLQGISLVLLALLMVWIGLVLLARRSYVDEFRDSLEDQVEPEEEPMREESPVVAQAATEDEHERVIERLLSSRDVEDVVNGLRHLEEGDERVPVSSVQRLLGHKAPDVRRRAIRVLRTRDVVEIADLVTPHLEDVAPEVRLEAARYLYRTLNGERLPLLERGLAHHDARVRSMVLGLIYKEGGPRAYGLISDNLLREMASLQGEHAEEAHLQVARVLGVLARPALDDLLDELLEHPSPAVRARALRSVGMRGARRFLPVLFDHLKEEEYRPAAAAAIAVFGDRLLGTTYDYLVDPNEDEVLRCRLPAALAGHRTQATVDVLMTALKEATIPVRHAIIKALGRLRGGTPRLRFAWKLVRVEVRSEARHYAAIGQIYYLWKRDKSEAAEMFTEEDFARARHRTLENIFRLLGLYYLQDDMLNAYRGLISDQPDLRAGAIEFIDNLLDWDTKQFLLPILDDPNGEQATKNASEVFDLQLTRWPEALAYLIRIDDPALNILAIQSARRLDEPGLQAHINAARHHPNPHVRHAALQLLNLK